MYSFIKPKRKDIEKYPDLEIYKENKVLYINKDKIYTCTNNQGIRLFILDKRFFNRAEVIIK